MSHQLREAQYLDMQVKESYRRGHRDGIIAGLKKAKLMSDNIILDSHATVLEILINSEIKSQETKEI